MMGNFFSRAFCRHQKVKIIRWHPDVVPVEWKGKELYTDVYNVSNFVQCCWCGNILDTEHREKIYEQKGN